MWPTTLEPSSVLGNVGMVSAIVGVNAIDSLDMLYQQARVGAARGGAEGAGCPVGDTTPGRADSPGTMRHLKETCGELPRSLHDRLGSQIWSIEQSAPDRELFIFSKRLLISLRHVSMSR